MVGGEKLSPQLKNEETMTRVLKSGLLILAMAAPLSGQMAVSHSQAAPSFEVAAPVADGKPVARVNGAVLTDRDLLREMYSIFPYARQHNGGFPKAMEADIRTGALKMIVFEELVYQEALRRKLSIPPAKLERAVSEFRKQFPTPDEYNGFLKIECKGSRQVLRGKIERSLLIDQLLNSEVNGRSAISLAQVRTYYEKNPDQFRIPESYAIQTISILPKANATASQQKELRAKAEEALRQAKATKDYEEFGVLAEKISEDDYRVMMGDRHAMDRTKMPPEVLKAAEALQPGQVSEVIPLEQGYTIIRLNAHIPAGMQKFEAVKDAIRKQLSRQKTEQLRSALDKRLRAHAKVEEL
jgi:parvulin-like peptidyl-prolyl isomerase